MVVTLHQLQQNFANKARTQVNMQSAKKVIVSELETCTQQHM